MHRYRLLPLVLALAAPLAQAYDANDWPTHFTTDSGYEFGVKGTYQADTNRFSDDTLPNGRDDFTDLTTWRRKEFYLYSRKKGVYELYAGYDFQAHLWVDNYLKLFAGKYGDFRIGHFKTPVGFEDGAIGSGATTFLERGLPEAAIYEGRRIGADWTYAPNKAWLLNLAYFDGGDLNGDNDGHTFAARAVLNPWANETQVLHLGASASREERDDEAARVRAKPEASLTAIRLIDTGNLTHTKELDRWGLEGAWRNGPFLAQAEYLGINASREAGLRDFSGEGWYASGSWLLTGESKPYKAGAFSNPAPKRDWGAVELAVRYSTFDLNDGPIHGGREHDWTLGANWYLTTHFKFQANYIRATSDRGNLSLDPKIVEVRAQLSF